MNTMKPTKENIRQKEKVDMKMSTIREELLGKANFNLISIGSSNNRKTGMNSYLK